MSVVEKPTWAEDGRQGAAPPRRGDGRRTGAPVRQLTTHAEEVISGAGEDESDRPFHVLRDRRRTPEPLQELLDVAHHDGLRDASAIRAAPAVPKMRERLEGASAVCELPQGPDVGRVSEQKQRGAADRQ